MKYRFDESVVYTKVCGVSMLVTLHDAWDRFPAIKEMTPIQGCFCEGISKEMDEEELLSSIRLPPKMTRETVRERFQIFIKKMVAEGFILAESDDDRS